jgi:hypothetical protein
MAKKRNILFSLSSIMQTLRPGIVGLVASQSETAADN